VFDIFDQSELPITAKSAHGFEIYLTCNSNIIFLSFLAFQLPSSRKKERKIPSPRKWPRLDTLNPLSQLTVTQHTCSSRLQLLTRPTTWTATVTTHDCTLKPGIGTECWWNHPEMARMAACIIWLLPSWDRTWHRCAGTSEHGTCNLWTKPDSVTCCHQTCRTQPNGVGNHAQPLTPSTWRMNVVSIAWLSSLMFPFRFCLTLRMS